VVAREAPNGPTKTGLDYTAIVSRGRAAGRVSEGHGCPNQTGC